MTQKKCELCGISFTPKNKKVRFCSKKCANTGERPYRKTGKNINCHICNKTFYARKHLLDSGKDLCCSHKCGRVVTAKKLENKVLSVCDYCSKEYKSRPSRILNLEKANYNNYCSKKCSELGRRTGENKECKHCKTIYWENKSENRSFCSKECSNEYGREIRICKNCGEAFKLRKSDRPQHCSMACWKENAKIYPRTSHLRNIIRMRWKINNLDDWYIKAQIKNLSGLSYNDIPKELIELKRLNMKRKRKIKEITHGNSH